MRQSAWGRPTTVNKWPGVVVIIIIHLWLSGAHSYRFSSGLIAIFGWCHARRWLGTKLVLDHVQTPLSSTRLWSRILLLRIAHTRSVVFTDYRPQDHSYRNFHSYESRRRNHNHTSEPGQLFPNSLETLFLNHVNGWSIARVVDWGSRKRLGCRESQDAPNF